MGHKSDKTAAFTELLSRDSFDVDEYDAFLENWQQLVDRHEGNLGDQETLPDLKEIERAAEKALSRLIENDGAGSTAGSQLFDHLQIGAVICRPSGHVEHSNAQAMEKHGLQDSSELGDAKLRLLNGDAFGASVFQSLKQPSSLNILQCFNDEEAPVNLAVLPIQSGSKMRFLIVFMDTPWGEEAAGLLAAQFGLTEAEAEIVGKFANGISLKQIAEERGRSYQTIRNQFGAVLEKTGCPNQADLLRLLLGTSYLFFQIQSLASAMEPPRGKVINMARPSGRFLEVEMFGDLTGEPFICLPSIFGMPITPTIETELRGRGLLMLGVSRPGFGGTSPSKPGQNTHECLAGDVTALLDSLEVERCVFVGRASAARAVFNLARLIPERMSCGVLVNSLVPRPYLEEQTRSGWAQSLISATRTSPTMTSLILGAGNRLRLQMGTARFFARMYGRSDVDTKAAYDPMICESLSRGIGSVTQQGLRAGVYDMIEAFADWRDEVAAARAPVTLFHGLDDPHVPIAAARRFAEDFSEQIELHEVSDGGGLLNYTHADQILDLVEAG